MSKFGSFQKFLKASLLKAPQEWWTTLFGFRALGYEDEAVATPACKTANSECDVLATRNHTETTIVWLATERSGDIPLHPDGPMVNHLLKLTQTARGSNDECFVDGKSAALLNRAQFPNVKPGPQSDFRFIERSILKRLLQEKEEPNRSEDISTNQQIILCSMEVEDKVLQERFCTLSSPTPLLYANAGGVEIHGLWLLHACDGKKSATRFFFWSTEDIMKKAGWEINLCSIDSTIIPNTLRDIAVDQWNVCREKLNRVTSRLTGSLRPRNVMPERFAELNLFPVCLYDETSTHYVLCLQPNRDIFAVNTLAKESLGIKSSNDLQLEITALLKCNPINGSSSYTAEMKTTVSFCSPVACTDWDYKQEKGLLEIPKAKHAFFSTVRRNLIPGCVSFADVHWRDAVLQYFSGAQFSKEERPYKLRKENDPSDYKMPMLIEVKDSIMTLLQLKDTLIYILVKEPGVGVVGFIIRHGVGMNCQRGNPMMDVSVCFLSSKISPEMANAVDHLNPNGMMRSIKMWREEYCLFQNICNYNRATMAPKFRTEHPSLCEVIPNKRARANFRRVVLSPLFPAAAETVLEDILARHFTISGITNSRIPALSS